MFWRKFGSFQPSGRETRRQILDRLYRADAVLKALRETPEIVAELEPEAWEALYEVLFCPRRVPASYRVTEDSILMILRLIRKWTYVISQPSLGFWIGTVAWHWSHGSPPVAEAAEACLPVLQTRWRTETNETTLLRAVSDPGAESLLRAASNCVDPDTSNLLRAAPTEYKEKTKRE
jgi:hypothetical protein